MHLLLVAPNAPPKNSPEAIQVGRFLAALDPEVRVMLITTPATAGWASDDQTLHTSRIGMRVITAALPYHHLSQRFVGNHRLQRYQIPDSEFWLPMLARFIVTQLDAPPDVIYSRSSPFSAALLALRLKERLRRPWLMHLSDPWAGSPYRTLPPRRASADLALEAACVSAADCITLTTEGQATIYQERYPQKARSISVTPNMCDFGNHLSRKAVLDGGQLRIVHTGTLYKDRDPRALISALSMLRTRNAKLAEKLRIEFYGNMYPEMAALIGSAPECKVHGPIPYEHANHMQRNADILLSIEPNPKNEFHPHFLLSKVVDYLASGRPMLALAGTEGVAAQYCRRGYGWVFAPNDAEGIADFLEHQLCSFSARTFQVPNPPNELAPSLVTSQIESLLRSLESTSAGSP